MHAKRHALTSVSLLLASAGLGCSTDDAASDGASPSLRTVVAFTLLSTDDGSMRVMDADGGNVLALSTFGDRQPSVYPSLSRDGRELTYMKRIDGTEISINTRDVEGGSDRELTRVQSERPAIPVFSRDGQRIVFATRPTHDSAVVWVMNSDGSDLQRLLDMPATDGIRADFSPDGGAIVFPHLVDIDDPGSLCGDEDRCNDYRVFSMSADGSNIRLVGGELSREPTNPVFSVDGTQIAYAVGEIDGSGRIQVMNVDGSDDNSVVRTTQNDVVLQVFSPDGKSLGYTDRRPDLGDEGDENGSSRHLGLFQVDIETGRVEQLTHAPPGSNEATLDAVAPSWAVMEP